MWEQISNYGSVNCAYIQLIMRRVHRGGAKRTRAAVRACVCVCVFHKCKWNLRHRTAETLYTENRKSPGTSAAAGKVGIFQVNAHVLKTD